MIHVIALIRLNPGRRDAWLKEAKALVPQVRAEAGCIQYQPTIDVAGDLPRRVAPRPDAVVVIEKWADMDALKAHMAAPHMAAYRERVKDYVAGVELQVLTDV